MKFENTRTARPNRFDHRAAIYPDARRLVEIALPILRTALHAGCPAVLLTSPATEEMLRQALVDPAGVVSIPPPSAELRGSGQAVVTALARQLRELTDWAGPLSVVVEHRPGASRLASSAWAEADAALNVALADLPITMTCLFPAPTTESASKAINWNHVSLLNSDGQPIHNPAARAPDEVSAALCAPAPVLLERPHYQLSFTPWQLTDVRAAVAEASEATGMSYDRAQDFVLAVNEVAGNAVEHGSGIGLLRLWRTPQALICEIGDTGTLGPPLVGLRAPHPHAARGRGMWIARQLCDLLHVWSDQHGTHVRMQITPR